MDSGGKYFAIALVGTTLVYLWPGVYWLGPRHWSAGVGIVSGLIAMAAYHRRYSKTGQDWGFSWPDLLPGLGWTLGFTVPIALALFAAGPAVGHLAARPRRIEDLFGMFLWGLAQQFVLQTVVLREICSVWPGRGGITSTALLFALLHLPNPFLTPATFLGAWIWCWIYRRHPNVLPLALSHALVTLAILTTLPRSVTGGMRVGYSYLMP
jgi:membrane protease YdiL (CAAX protease family)